MNALGKNSTAYICYIIVNVWWYLSCLIGVFIPAFIIYEYVKGSHPDHIFGITIPLSHELVSLSQPEASSYLAVDAVEATVDFEYIMQQNPDTYIIWSLFILAIIALFLIGVYQLRELLRTTVYDSVFSKSNVRRIKVIAFLVILIEPLEWIRQHFVYRTLGDIVAKEAIAVSITLPTPGGGWGFVLVGLLIFALAAVFERGYEMYQELKLTV